MANIDGTEDIIQNVVLAGQTEVIAGLAAIALAGKTAFAAISTGITNTSFTGFISSLTGIVESIALVTAGTFAWAQASTNAVYSMENLAEQAGTTTGQMSAFVGAMTNAGASVDNMTVALRRAAVRVATDWPIIQKSVREAANVIIEDQNRIKESSIALSEAQIKNSVQDTHATQLRISNALAMRGAALSVEQAELRLAEAYGHVAPSWQKYLNQQQAQLALDEAIANQRTVRQKKLEDEAEAADKKSRAALEVAVREQQLAEANRKQQEDSANAVATLIRYVDNLAKGFEDANLKVNKSADNIVRGIIASVGASEGALKGFSGSIGDLALSAPSLEGVILKTADVFHGLRDETVKNAVAVSEFGRGYDQSLIRVLSRGSEAIIAERQRLESLGFTFAGLEEKANDFREAFGRLSTAIRIVGTQLGLLFAPAFTAVLNDIRIAIEQNRASIIAWGQAIVDKAIPPILALVNVITGIKSQTNFRLTAEQVVAVDEWEKTFRAIGAKVNEFFTKTLPTAYGVAKALWAEIKGDLQDLTALINKVFGTKIKWEELGIALLIGQLTGLNGLIVQLGTSFVGLAILFVANFAAIRTAAVSTAAAISRVFLPVLALYLLAKELKDVGFGSIPAESDDLQKKNEEKDRERKRRGDAPASGLFKEGQAVDILGNKIAEVEPKVDSLEQKMDELAKRAAKVAEEASSKWQAYGTEGVKAVESIQEQTRRFNDELKALGGTGSLVFTGLKDGVRQFSISMQDELLLQKRASESATGTLKTSLGDYIDAKRSIQSQMERLAEKGEFRTSDKGAKVIAAPSYRKQLQDQLKTETKTQAEDSSPWAVARKSIEDAFSPLVKTMQGYFDTITSGAAKAASDISQSMAKAFQSVADAGVAIRGPGTSPYSPLLPAPSQQPRVPLAGQQNEPPERVAADEANRRADAKVDAVAQGIRDVFNSATESAKASFGQLGAAVALGVEAIYVQFRDLGPHIAQAWENIKGTVSGAFTGAEDAIAAIGTKMSSVGEGIKGVWNEAVSSTTQSVNQMVASASLATEAITRQFTDMGERIANVWNSIKNAASGITLPNPNPQGVTTPSAISTSSGAPGLAEGGTVKGRKGKDTNLAYLSDHEFVMKTGAVEHYGEGFMHAINNMKIPKYDFGGLVERMSSSMQLPSMSERIPTYAAGGLNQAPASSGGGSGSSGKSVFTLQIGGNSYNVEAHHSVVQAVKQAAAQEQYTSTGRPSWDS